MTIGHLPAKTDNNESRLPNESFFGWLSKQTSLFVGHALAILSVLGLLISLIYYAKHNGVTDEITLDQFLGTLQKIVIVLHIIFILLFIFKLARNINKNDDGSYRVSKAYKRIFGDELRKSTLNAKLKRSKLLLRKFKFYFIFFWVSMLILYVAFFLKGQETDIRSFISDSKIEAFYHIGYKVATLVLNAISTTLIFWCLSLLYVPYQSRKDKARQMQFVYFSGIFAAILILVFVLSIDLARKEGLFTHFSLIGYVSFFLAIIGTLTAVVLALLIARLDSKLIGLPSWLVSILYLYAAVQPLVVVFEQPGIVNETITSVVFVLVFILKIYFFLIIVYTMQTGRMLNYLFCFPFLNHRVNSIFDNQFEFKIEKEDTHVYSFVINKASALIYKSNTDFRNRVRCDQVIKNLCEDMGNRDSYTIRESNGTYNVQIRSKNKIVCSSSDLKSLDEAIDLIDESINKIRFCKLNYIPR